MVVRLFTGVLVATCVAACSSLPDIKFDDAPGDGGPVVDGNVPPVTCNCQALPAGWVPVSFSGAARPTCPNGSTVTDLRVASGDGTPACSCTCSDVGGSCKTGNSVVTITGESSCGVGPATINVAPDQSACTAIGSSVTVPAGAFAKTTHPPPTSCGPKAAITNAVTDGRLCASSPTGTCSAGQACVPAVASGFASCITKSGASACPADFPKRSTAGTAADTSAACVGCKCGAPAACTGGTASIYDDAACKTNGQNHGATGIGTSCASTSDSNFVASHFKSTPSTGGGCASAPSTPPTPGTFGFTEARTVCCK